VGAAWGGGWRSLLVALLSRGTESCATAMHDARRKSLGQSDLVEMGGGGLEGEHRDAAFQVKYNTSLYDHSHTARAVHRCSLKPMCRMSWRHTGAAYSTYKVVAATLAATVAETKTSPYKPVSSIPGGRRGWSGLCPGVGL